MTDLTKLGPPTWLPGKTLTISTPNSSAWAISLALPHPGEYAILAAVAEQSHLLIEQRADHEVGAVGDVEGGGGCIDDRADAHDDVQVVGDYVAHRLGEDVVGLVAAVGEFEYSGTPLEAGFDDVDGGLHVLIVEDGNDADVVDGVEDGHAIVLCHDALLMEKMERW